MTRDRTVALLLERPEDFLPALWACLLGGITVCPPVPLRSDPQRRAAQLGLVDTLLDGPLLVTDAPTREQLPAVRDLSVVTLEDLAPDDTGTATDAGPGTVPLAPAAPDDVALLVHTSGSTSAAKAVRLTHGNLLASMAAKAGTQSLTSREARSR
ncbi:AMP-binding protein [Streptomyces sp. NPDC048568]|uniref:AMP-binding protein n=1 Tax=Streptomyces sp. NPDC048568 TaxID=3365571 RepID=UPI003716FBC8